jgi:hypothetical protein
MKAILFVAALGAASPAFAQASGSGPVAGVAAVPQVAQAPQAATAAVPVVAVAKQEIAGTNSFLPPNTQVDVTLNSEVSSKRVKEGQSFTLSVSHDVMLGDYVVIPKGTPANGKVVYRSGKGAFGKSAKMEIEVTDLQLNGRAVPLSGKFRQEGQGNTGATVGAAVAVGIFSAFVTGRSAVFEQGREFRVFTRDALPVVLAQAAPATTAPISAAALPAPPTVASAPSAQ